MVGAVLLAAACGGSDVSSETATQSTNEEAAESVDTAAEEQGEEGIEESAQPNFPQTPEVDDNATSSDAPIMVGIDREFDGTQVTNSESSGGNLPAGSFGQGGGGEAGGSGDGDGQFGGETFTSGEVEEDLTFFDDNYEDTTSGLSPGDPGTTLLSGGGSGGSNPGTVTNGAGTNVAGAQDAYNFGLEVLTLHFEGNQAGINALLNDPYYSLDGQGPHSESSFSIDPSLIGLNVNDYLVVYGPKVQNFVEWANEEPIRVGAVQNQGWSPNGTEWIFDGSVVKPGNQGVLPGEKMMFVVDPTNRQVIAISGDIWLLGR